MNKEIIKYNFPNLYFNIISLHTKNRSKYRGMHFHREAEIIKVTSGKIKCVVSGSEIILQQNEVLFINSNTMHYLEGIADSKVIYIQIDLSKYYPIKTNFDSQYIEEYMNFISNSSYNIINNEPEVSDILDKIYLETNEKKLGFELYIKGYIYQMTAFLNRTYVISNTGIETDKAFLKFLPMINYIEKNYSSKLSLDELSKIINYNKYQMCRDFKKLFTGTIVDYINYVRLQKAMDLLQGSSKSILDISLECGFASPQYFDRFFKKYQSCTPKDFRKLTLNI